jgi:hypothetical protein
MWATLWTSDVRHEGERCFLNTLEAVMGAFATVTIPLDLSRPGLAALALAEAERSAGSTDAAVTGEGITVKLQMPGNIRSLMGRLSELGLTTPAEVGVSVPVRSLAIPDLIPNVQHLLTTLNESGEVSNARIEGDAVIATTRPTSKGLYRIFYALLHEGLIAQDTPTLPAIRGL